MPEATIQALDLYKERELALLRESLGELEEEHKNAAETSRHIAAEMDYHRVVDDPGGEADPEDYIDSRNRIAERLWSARRIYLAGVAGNEETRKACAAVDVRHTTAPSRCSTMPGA
ncbi:hypothetical protein [Sphingomicrobium flavum]|uniref:hypothetical protein n=1 Tax=Sphingomicrobium flavum TaxID=1229164 RepID=UPI0021AD76F1|nr:hypothetical protein [Sphingomicrobium flavum]